jgi:hypothetical protein
MTDEPRRREALPRSVLVIAYVLVLLASLVVGTGVLMANVMTCASGTEGCSDRALLATGVWGVITYLLPAAAFVWGLIASADTPGGRRSRIIALILIIVLPILGIGINLLVLFGVEGVTGLFA